MSQVSPNDDLQLDEDSFFSEMLSSQSDLENQIQSLKIDSHKNVEEKLDELQKILSSGNLKNATVDILDEKIFGVVLPEARKVYSEIIKNIDEALKNKQNDHVDRIKEQLNFLGNLLKCWDSCLKHIKSLEKLSIIDIRNFTVSFFEIMIDALDHCKNSGKNYDSCFQSVGELLAKIFRQCANILNLFYDLLDTSISFDTNQNEEMEVLSSIIDETGKIAVLTSGMDAKTLTDMWKKFGKLVTNYNLQMKKVSPHRVTSHLKGLSENIVDALSSINQKNQRSSNERSILCCRVLFKILEKLCETYCGWIRNDVMLAIVALLAHTYRYTEQCLKIVGYSPDFIKFVETNFAFMIEPFLEVALKNESFKMAFFEYDNNMMDNKIGYHMLALTIIKKMSVLPYESQREWCGKENNVIDICFRNVDKLSKDICTGQLLVQMSRNVTQGSYLANIYEATCLSIFSLVCQISSSDFDEFVVLLLKYLLSGKFFSCLLCTDVWCFVCRLGSSDLCYSHFKYLMQSYEMLKERKNNMNVVMLSNLLSRQYAFLSDKDKLDFISNIKKDSSSHGWDAIARTMNEEKKKLLQQQVNAFDMNNKIASDLRNLEEQASLENFRSLMNDLSVIEASGVPQDGQSAETFVKMWDKIVCILGECEGTSLALLEDLAICLLHATRPQQGQVKYTTSVLESLVSLYPYSSSGLRLGFCQFLECCAVQLTEAHSSVVCELFSRLLSDNEPCVQQQALECFEHLTHVCPDAGLLSAVAVDIRNAQSEVSRSLPAFISGETIHQLSGFSSLADYFQALCEAMEASKHVCRKNDPPVEREEKLPRLDEESNEDVEMVSERVCRDVEFLVRLRGRLSKNSADKLRRVIQGFLDQGNV